MTSQKARLRVIGYCRVSTDKQSRQYGLGAQSDALQQYCQEHGYELLTITMDVASGSASDCMHGREIAVTALEAGVADALLVRALDRATRDQEDAAKLFKRAERYGWRLMDCDKADSGDPSQRLLADIRLAVAAEERRKISERTREGLARARRNGKTLGRRPEVDDAVARRIVGMHARGLGANTIARELSDAGVPTPRGGDQWYSTTVRGILKRASRESVA